MELFLNFFRNFERPFTPRTWPAQPPNFGKTRFGRFPTFHFSTPKKNILRKFCEKKLASNQKRAVLEEPRIFERYWQIGLEK